MKKIITKSIISTAVFTALSLMFGVSLAATANNSSTPTNTTKQTTKQSTAKSTLPSHSKMVQDFQNDNLSVQFRYADGKLVGVRLLNTGANDMAVTVANTHYILGPNDFVVMNPPNTSSVHIFHAPFLTPITAVEAVFPNRFGKDEVYLIPKNINDSLVNTSSVTKPSSTQ